MNTGFLRLYIYTFRYFEKEKQKINSLKLSGYICFASYILTLSKWYFGCRQSYISADAEVAVFIHNLPAAQTALLKSHCRGGNAHSYACLHLFLHASTKVSCVGFIMRCPFREMRRMLLFWPTDCRKRQSVVLCLHTPFPREYTVSRGDPNLAMPRNDIKYFVRNKTNKELTSLKSQNFDAIKPHKYTVSCGDPVTVLDGFVRRHLLGFPSPRKQREFYNKI